MPSIYERALGEGYQYLHPEIKRKFALSSEQAVASRAEGVMNEIWGGRIWMRPFLHLGGMKRLTFSERGQNIPFSLENYAYLNSCGQECMAWIRKFHFKRTRHFDATMVYSENQRKVIDYLGSDQDLVTSLDIDVMSNGGIKLVSGPLFINREQKTMELPSLFSAKATAKEWFNDEQNRFHIEVDVQNRYFGTIFGYKGTFTVQYYDFNGNLPSEVKPRKEKSLNLL
ncbi:DUF4166 domain-containing protein [Halalkalibacter hemicellulosilyticus]|uniref:DUF4166 domain-containing protein n=1 Tax=Halalkalibacter hemicellulosilyticusJCM 9152 TaxID=1236971 RepID=W4QC30_9BACI|nr:DUF4166 domain-containing protein [Halalkalibacter hemicellulosilyticus]GAE29590.1 hypothetical protein JCM9152_956 [Halalkalibacter hemicellulosilyticusJCM 9152]